MAAYILFIRENPVRDAAEMATYGQMNHSNPPDPKLSALAVYGAIDALEGAAPDGVVLLQFPTVEDAKAWYNSPGYQAASVHRKKGADYRALIIQGL
ncbi:MAG: hypothetical protein JWQ90_2802 [Hydrocarboniphaga sp.]|uniref:DUF1330 domain-containing protein n=1 Tax=Hydrocarboniphaga sp. TaxID=2033016 RepID=UPI00262B489B|nr:DUF1330 domain-containing protein [Hydrocarboniphaga sp.]MDB5970352.1 hypothetical protein [Hydrocarboniphaga sp.]